MRLTLYCLRYGDGSNADALVLFISRCMHLDACEYTHTHCSLKVLRSPTASKTRQEYYGLTKSKILNNGTFQHKQLYRDPQHSPHCCQCKYALLTLHRFLRDSHDRRRIKKQLTGSHISAAKPYFRTADRERWISQNSKIYYIFYIL